MTYHDIFSVLFCNCLYKLYAEESSTHVKRNASAKMPKSANATKLPGRSSFGWSLTGSRDPVSCNQSVVFAITREYACRQKGGWLVENTVCYLVRKLLYVFSIERGREA